jgi:hypothetical protein
MRTKKYLAIYVILSLSIFNVKAQIKEYKAENFDYVGFKDNKNIYRYRDVNNPIEALDNSLYYSLMEENNTVSFVLYREQDKELRTILINDIVHIFEMDKAIIIQYRQEEYKFDNLRLNKNRGVAFDFENKVLYLAIKIAPDNYQLQIFDLKSAESKIYPLPLFGIAPFLTKNYLYFSSHHICDWYSVYTEDVYRVKIGDWNNPELVLENVDPGNWFLIPESNVIYADILEEQGKGVLYNADTKSYKIVDAIYGDRVIKYKGEYYYELKPNNKPISYKRVTLPSEYPQKDDRVLCPENKKRYFNLSNSQKPFSNTFITEELLYNAPETELSKLDKNKLRLLRNAFFARQGYQFKSKDLQEFFGQFEWYNELLKSYKVFKIANEDVVISPKDKERVELIMKIENRK